MWWKILGIDSRGRYEVLCYCVADSFDKAIEWARNYYGYLNVTGAQRL